MDTLSLQAIGDIILLSFFIVLLMTSIILTIKHRFIQFRMIPTMGSLLISGLYRKKKPNSSHGAIPSYQALFAAMSTTIGIGNIIGPAIAIKLGGPGALIYFLLALLFGAATTFSEVTFALHYRKQRHDGSFTGGPMHYITAVLGSKWSSLYAGTGALLLVVWSANQSNSLADIIAVFSIPRPVTGIAITAVVLFYLSSGIQKIGELAAKMVPFMFFLYCGACVWVIAAHANNIMPTLQLILSSAYSPFALSGAAAGLVVQKMLRWGLAKGIHISEAGIGTTSIPHSQAQTNNPLEQGILSMVSAYSVAIISTLSGLVVLVSGAWQDTSIPLGINLIAIPFARYIPASHYVLAASAFLFALGTILGNAYNGSQCFSYLSNNRWLYGYYALTGIVVFLGSIFDVEFIWSITDFFILPVVIPSIISVVYLTFKRFDLFARP